MGQPAAKQGDRITATDTHIEMVPVGSSTVPTPIPNPFTGVIDGSLSNNVKIMGKPAATVDSTATNTPSHAPKAGPFQKSPKNKGKISVGSATVKINGKKAARNGDTAITCNDPADQPVGKVVASGSVIIGG